MQILRPNHVREVSQRATAVFRVVLVFQRCTMEEQEDVVAVPFLRPRQTCVEYPEIMQRSGIQVVGCACKISDQTMSGRSANVQPATAASRIVLVFQRCTELLFLPCDLGK